MSDIHEAHAELQGSLLSKQRIIAHPGFIRFAELVHHRCLLTWPTCLARKWWVPSTVIG